MHRKARKTKASKLVNDFYLFDLMAWNVMSMLLININAILYNNRKVKIH